MKMDRMKEWLENRGFDAEMSYDSTILNELRDMVCKPQIKKVHFNNPATVILWTDGTKTIVKAQDGEPYDPEKGMALAIAKKFLGNKGNYYDTFKKWLPEEDTNDLGIADSPFTRMSEAFERLTKTAKRTTNPVEKAYDILLEAINDKTTLKSEYAAAIQMAIGYLGEALD